MNDILRLFFIIILLTIGLAAYFLIIGVLFTNRVTRAQRIINQMPARAIGVGLVNFLFFGVIAMILFSIAENTSGVIKVVLTMPALLIAGMMIVLLSFGLTGMVNVVGERILPEHSALKKSVWGSVLLTFACALPFVGWFL
ncbi:MAG: hypothetical protein ABIQ77_05740, partial [Anaerolineales bacterium]